MSPMILPDAATLYFWVWELLALFFILTTAYLITRVDKLRDMMEVAQRRQAWTDAYTAGVITREEYLANVNSNHRHKEVKA